MEWNDGFGLHTMLAHLGEEESPRGAVVPPIYQNSLFVFPTMEELLDAMSNRPGGPDHHYSRISNPSMEVVERKLAHLEGADDAKVFGCGMAAISAAIMSTVRSGAHVVTVDTAYGPVRSFLDQYLGRFGVTHTLVTGNSTEELLDAIRPETTTVYLESPSSMLFRMQDLEPITKVCRERGVTTIIDNTYNTPLHLQPHAWGVDLVCHSATKYLGGHSDITGGVVTGSAERMRKMHRNEVSYFGAALHPFPSWLMNRGIRTLALRVKRHEQTANAVASWLEAQPFVERVHHVGLESHPQRDLVHKYLKGTGGLFSFQPKVQDKHRVFAFCNALNLFQKGISWGGHESLVVALPVQPADYPAAKWTIRLYTGLEEPEDLIADLAAATPNLA